MVDSKSKAERVYTLLRADVLAGRHAPGQRLRYAELCEKYEASMGVIREALLRLAEQGLIKGEPQQGFQVVSLSREDLVDLTDARCELETTVLGLAVRHGDIEWESRAIAAHHRLVRTPQLEPDDPERLSDAWVAAHAEFHDLLLDGCPNRRLKGIALALRDSAELYRRWSLPLGEDPDRDVAQEHLAILEAVVDRNAEEATARLRAHVLRTTESLLTSKIAVDSATSDL